MLINCVITVHFVLGQTDCHCASNPTPYALSSPADVDKFFIPPTPTKKIFSSPTEPTVSLSFHTEEGCMGSFLGGDGHHIVGT